MKTRIITTGTVLALLLTVGPTISRAGGDGFNDAVKAIEQFYHVRHQNVPLLARAGAKAVSAAARIKGGDYRRLAEAGSVRVAFFEDQEFNSRGQIATFKASMQATLADSWSPLVQTLAPRSEEQTYIYIRTAGEKFNVLVVTIERHEATVIQATIVPHVLAQLMKDPADMGKALTDDATINDN
jgi:hypothetical protein